GAGVLRGKVARSPAPCNCSSTGIGMDESSKSGLAGPAATRIGAAASAKSVVRENPARPEGAPGRLHGKPHRAWVLR
ncbi:hypothetical protein PPH41_31480, partial [Burkholderia gladioli]|nr:hypothetical protein [Burkholderia gladioli]